MAWTNRTITADDVLDLPLPNGVSGYELVDGRPVPVTPASPVHGRLIVRIGRLLDTYVEEAGLDGVIYSDAGFVLSLRRDRERMRASDLAYVARAKVEAHPNPERLFRCVPDLAVEIDLTSTKKPGGQQRIVDCVDAGVRLVWVLDPRSRTVTVYRPDGSARLLRDHDLLEGEDVLPGFQIRTSQLFG